MFATLSSLSSSTDGNQSRRRTNEEAGWSNISDANHVSIRYYAMGLCSQYLQEKWRTRVNNVALNNITSTKVNWKWRSLIQIRTQEGTDFTQIYSTKQALKIMRNYGHKLLKLLLFDLVRCILQPISASAKPPPTSQFLHAMRNLKWKSRRIHSPTIQWIHRRPLEASETAPLSPWGGSGYCVAVD